MTRATWFEAERLAIADVSTLYYCAKSGTTGGDVNREPATPAIAAPPSPRVDARPFLRRPRLRLRHSTQACHDPAPRFGGVDHVVDLEHRGDRDRFAVGIEFGDLVAKIGLALLGISDRLHLLAEAEADIAFQPHAAELAGRPGRGEERRMEAAPDHRLRPQAIALAQHDAEQRHG